MPVVGEPLAGVLQDAGEGAGGEVAEAGREGEEDVTHLASVLGALFFLLPAAAVLSRYLSGRIAMAS